MPANYEQIKKVNLSGIDPPPQLANTGSLYQESEGREVIIIAALVDGKLFQR
jgi:hypothetical protein